jgi:hypothetical protein
MNRIRARLCYANVAATLALFISLGGGSAYAITSIIGPDGVIHGCYQNKKGTLRIVKAGAKCLKSEKAIAWNQKGSAGRPGLQGAKGDTGATGAQGAQGQAGQDLTFNTALRSGQTETGIWSVAGPNSTTGFMETDISFHPQLPAALTSSNVHLQRLGTTSANCPSANPPRAAANQLCFYEFTAGTDTLDAIIDPQANSGGNGASVLGAEIVFNLNNAKPAIERGAWAYTAP